MKKIISLIIIIILAAGAITLLKKRKAQRAKAPTAAVLPVVVDTVTLQSAPVTLTLPAMGTVASELSSTLSTKISGRVTKVFKQEGDSIRKGEKLATIDARDLLAKQAALRSKIAGIDYTLTSQRESHQRTLDLLNIGGASLEQSQHEEAAIANLEQNKESLEQSIQEIEALISYATITAPICGTLSKRLVQVGDLATPGKPLFKISSCSGQYLNISLPDTLSAEKIILNGQELPLSAKNEASMAGLAQYIAPLPPEDRAMEGQFLNVLLVVYQGKDCLIPVDGLLSVGDGAFVFVLENGKASKKKVNIVARGSEGVVVTPNLAGQTILAAKPDILLRTSSGVPVITRKATNPSTSGGQNNG